jgi:hypothetical protein
MDKEGRGALNVQAAEANARWLTSSSLFCCFFCLFFALPSC